MVPKKGYKSTLLMLEYAPLSPKGSHFPSLVSSENILRI